MPPLHLHSYPPLLPSLNHYSAQKLHFHGQLQIQERQQADPSPCIIARRGRVRDVAIGACSNRCVRCVLSAELRAKTLNMQYDFTISVHRPLWTVLTLMQAYRKARLCEGCGDFCVRRLVRGVCDIGWIASSVFELPIWLNNCRSIMTSIILLGGGFGDHLVVRAIRETLKWNQTTLGNQKSPPSCHNVEQIWDYYVYR